MLKGFMAIELFNTLSGKIKEFRPLRAAASCG
jgi:hypothetical protein